MIFNWAEASRKGDGGWAVLSRSVAMGYPRLFEPAKIGGMELKNRIKFAATGTGFCSEHGKITPQEIAWLVERAKGGAGLITTTGTSPHPTGVFSKVQPPNWDDCHIPELRKLAEAIKKHGAKACVQIVHTGRYASPEGEPPVGPSAVPSTVRRWQNVRELKPDEIKILVEAHGEAVRRAKVAGFDAAEIGAMAGYLIASFLSPWTNRRTDGYGGGLENRARFLLECIENAREKVGGDYPLLVRMCADERIEGGNTPEDMRTIAKLAEKVGVNAISLTVGWHESRAPGLTMDIPHGHWLYLAEGMKRVLNIPVCMAFRLNSPVIAERAIENGNLDFWEMCRPLIADPELPNKLAQGREEDIAPCIACMEGCYARIFNHQPVRCLINARAGREWDERYQIKLSATRKKVLIAGGGPGGLEAARVAAMRGHEVTLYEKGSTLGGQFDLASRPPYRQEIGDAIKYLSAQIRKLGVEVVLQQEVTPALVKETKPQVVVVATGSSPMIPKIPGMQHGPVVTAHSVLSGKVKVGARVVVWGGSQIGVETAELLASQGKKVTIVEESTKVGRDITIFDVWAVRMRLHKLGVKMLTTSVLREMVPGAVIVFGQDGEQTIPVDTVVVAKKLKANKELRESLEGEVNEIYSVGDCVAPRKAINAIHDGFRVGVQI
jgi:2,4-dienoyl-CoA reductase (NADPH2)